jgi:hypothetical protein
VRLCDFYAQIDHRQRAVSVLSFFGPENRLSAVSPGGSKMTNSVHGSSAFAAMHCPENPMSLACARKLSQHSAEIGSERTCGTAVRPAAFTAAAHRTSRNAIRIASAKFS